MTLLDPDGGPLAANLDGLCRPMGANIEAKSVNGTIDPDEWGEPWTDQVPPRVIIQTHVAMICGKLSISYVPMVMPIYKRFEFRIFEIKFNPALAAEIRDRAISFWNDNVLAEKPPEDSIGTLEVLKKMKREPETVAEVDDALVQAWEAAKEEEKAANEVAKDAKERSQEAQARILSRMTPINADGCITESGKRLTFLETQNKGYTVEPFSYRVMRVAKKNRK